MDYESLYQLLPKEPKKWQVQDVVVWLKFIGLGQMEDKFVKCSVDGSVLEEITDKELEEELEITQKIIKKKLMNWLTIGLKEYCGYLKKVSTIKNEETLKSTSQLYELILQPLECQQNNFYCIKESGAKIGRHSSNQILILEENISRYHAEVTYSDKFYIRDIGSTTGTYIKVQKSLILHLGMLLELGSNLFLVRQLDEMPNGAQIGLLVIEGPNQDEQINFNLNHEKPSVTLGRKATVEIAFPEDHHLSNQHAKFYLIGNSVTIEDHSSTNGTWLRLSADGQVSSPYPITGEEETTIIRIGTVNQYLCQLDKQIIKGEQNNCIICHENQKDSLCLPCKHNSTCFNCSQGLQLCPICSVKIKEQIRIYKN